LRFTVETGLQGRAAELKESTFAIAVFNRPADFDPRADPIVRVQAKKLRDRLNAYYEADGANDRIRIEFQKGSYVPQIQVNPPDTAPVNPPKQEGRPWLIPSMLAVSVALAAVAWYGFQAPPAAGKVRSLAVLPFVNLSEQEFGRDLSDGLTHELITVLGSVPDLRVVASTSAFRYRGQVADVRQIGRELGVATILEGVVRKDKDLLRIQARLIDVANGYQLWSGSYDRSFKSILDVQGDLSRSILQEVRGKLGVSPLSASARPTNSEKAYFAFLRAKYFQIKPAAEQFPKAIAAFEEATAADPNFAAAYAGMSMSYALSVSYAPGQYPDGYARARVAAKRAIAIDPESADAHAALGYIAFADADWKGTEHHLREAVRLNPGHTYGHQWLGSAFLLYQGQLKEALAELKLALATDPSSVTIHHDTARIYWFTGDHENALKYYRAAIELEPNWARAHRDLGVILALRGDWDQAIYESKNGMELSHRNPAHLADLGWIYGAAGKTSEAMAVIQEINERVRKERISPALSVKTWLGLGDHERALAALQQTADRETWPNSFLFLDERYAKFRQDPRVREEGQRIGLPCLECGLNSGQTKPSNAL